MIEFSMGDLYFKPLTDAYGNKVKNPKIYKYILKYKRYSGNSKQNRKKKRALSKAIYEIVA